jgi:hypothetical protein
MNYLTADDYMDLILLVENQIAVYDDNPCFRSHWQELLNRLESQSQESQ